LRAWGRQNKKPPKGQGRAKVLSDRERKQFTQVCWEHIWAAVGMHVLYQASGSKSEAHCAALSVRELIRTAPAFRECWEVVRPTVQAQGFHSFISIVEEESNESGLTDDDDPTAEHRIPSRKAAATEPVSADKELIDDDTASMPRVVKGVDEGAEGGLPLARLRVLSGRFAGRELGLTNAVTQLGHPGEHVVAISREIAGYSVTSLENSESGAGPLVNGETIGPETRTLRDNDLLQIAGIQARFELS
jgi:hypothetical protein